MDKGYIPTLGQYAEIIDWMTRNPNKDIPVRMERAYKDAMARAELKRLSRMMGA